MDRPELVEGKRVCLVEDDPTLTHGEMPYGAGRFAADKYGAAEIVDPRPYLRGSLHLTYRKYPHLGKVIPAMGYWQEQVRCARRPSPSLTSSCARAPPLTAGGALRCPARAQVVDLEETINAVPCETVIIATPMDLRRIIHIDKPVTSVVYAVEDREPPFLNEEVDRFLKAAAAAKVPS